MTSNVIPLKSQQAPQATQRVAPLEAQWLRQAEMESFEVARQWCQAAAPLRAQINRLDHALRECAEQHAVVREQHRDKDFVQFHPKFPQALYWPLLGLAALLETPLNNSALGFLGMDDLETAMVAVALGMLNVLGASFVGWKLRQAPWSRAGLRDWLFVLVMLGVCLALMFGLAGLRLDDLLLKAKEADIPVSQATFSTFVLMQLLFFVVGAFFSYSMHPADGELERILKDGRRLRSRLEALWHQRATLAARHDRALGQAEAEMAKLRADCLAKIAEYRDFNMAARTQPAPSWLHECLDERVFAPITLGAVLDTNPATIDALIQRAEARLRS